MRISSFKDALFTELFPGRTLVPKALIFCKDDSHAEDVVHICREVFGKGNDFAKKITYKTYNPETKRYEKSEALIQEFRTSPQLRIAVTVDMIATGTDIKPLECLLFLRDVRSRVYFEQMKGRGTRVLTPTDFARLIDSRAVDYIQPSVAKIGGISIMRDIILAANAADVKVAPHSAYFGAGLIATAHVSAALARE